MKLFILKSDLSENLYSFMRRCGYSPLRDSYIRRLASSGYPRFHIYIDEIEDKYVLNLHLDQKRPSYGRETAHSGEYDGDVVGCEMERIKELLVR